MIFRFKLSSVIQEIQERVGIDQNQLLKKHPYFSIRGARYDISEHDPFFSLGLRLTRCVNWGFVIYTFVFSAIKGCMGAIASRDKGYTIFYFVTLFVCVGVIIIMRLTRSLAFRKAKLTPQRLPCSESEGDKSRSQ